MCGHGSLSRLPGSVCVCTVQTLCCCRVHQRLVCQLFSSFPSGETLRGPTQKGRPPPTGGNTKPEGRVDTPNRQPQHCYCGYRCFILQSPVLSSCLLSFSENVLILNCTWCRWPMAKSPPPFSRGQVLFTGQTQNPATDGKANGGFDSGSQRPLYMVRRHSFTNSLPASLSHKCSIHGQLASQGK